MRIALSGTPGTGKTSVCRNMGWDRVQVEDLAQSYGCAVTTGDLLEVDTDALRDRAILRGDVLIDGHLSHLLDVDHAIVLRCAPSVLRRRLLTRTYTEQKVEENVLAEALDVCLVEAVESLGEGHVSEVDTTNLSLKDTVSVVREALGYLKADDRRMLGCLRPGSVDWSDAILRGEVR